MTSQIAGEAFPLDRVENPHPDLVRKALQYRRVARTVTEIPDLPPEVVVAIGWLFYREACCDAGRWSALDMEQYLDRSDIDLSAIGHREAVTPPAVSQRVAMPRRPKDQA